MSSNLGDDLFLDCILMLIHDDRDKCKKTVSELIAIYETEIKQGVRTTTDVSKFYIKVLKSILAGSINFSIEEEKFALLLRFKTDPVIEKTPEIFELIKAMIQERDILSPDILESRMQRVQNALVWHRMNKLNRTMSYDLHVASDMADPDNQRQQLTKLLDNANKIVEAYNTSAASAITKKLTDRVSFREVAGMKEAGAKSKKRITTGVLKMGLQGLNRALGKAGGIARGESVCWCARSHHGKSLILNSVPVWAVMFNLPPDPVQKNLVLCISLENEVSENYNDMAKHIYRIHHKKLADHLTEDELAEEAMRIVEERGWYLEILRFLPSEFGYDEYVAVINHYKSLGYTVVLSVVDYLAKMKSSSGSSGAANHLNVKDTYSKMCNFNKNENIALATAQQLNGDAVTLANSGVANVVKKYHEKHIAEALDVMREVDCIFFQELEYNHDRIRFYTSHWYKHRYAEAPPETHKYFAYPLEQGFAMIEDIGSKVPRYTTDIYAYGSEDAVHKKTESLVQDQKDKAEQEKASVEF